MPEQPNGTISTVDPDFAPADFFALRTPLLPFDEFLAFGDGLTATKATPECLEEALTKDVHGAQVLIHVEPEEEAKATGVPVV